MHTPLSFAQFLADELNEPQREAVLHKEGPLMVIAGAGSGKTRVITARITHLILQEHVVPESIIALTFTNKAAQEMKQRISSFLPNRYNLPFVGTFHGYCLRLLKKYSYHADFTSFSILDDDDQKKMISDIIHSKGLHKTINVRNVLHQISHIKNNPMVVPTFLSATDRTVGEIYHAYEREKKLSKCFDFDDLLLEVLTLFKKNTSFRDEHHATIKHILVDEYQDTNYVQHELLKQMALSDEQLLVDSVCVVGDEDQSIYSWRGATIANMLTFSQKFLGTRIIKIEQNYRSVQPILLVANKIITNNVERNPKELWSDKRGVDRVRLLTCASEYQEADIIAHLSYVLKLEKKSKSVAILYRTHAQSRAIEEALIKHSIPYKIIGGLQFYERKEVKDLIAYLRVMNNPYDRPSFYRVLNTPTRGLGKKIEELVQNEWEHEPLLHGIQILQEIVADQSTARRSHTDGLHQFISLFEGVDMQWSPSTMLEYVIAKTHYLSYLQHEYGVEESQERIENVQELIDAVKHAESKRPLTLDVFLQEVALMQDTLHSFEDQQDVLLLMTIHAAKGLEFDMIVLCGLEEGVMPTTRATGNNIALEEERRLLYVAITRAREYVLLCSAKIRYTYGTMVHQVPSRFLDELPMQVVKKENASYWHQGQQRQFFADWFQVSLPQSIVTFGGASTGSFVGRSKDTLQKNSAVDSDVYVPVQDKKQDTRVMTNIANSLEKNGDTWRINQKVMHDVYGVGVVRSAEKRGDQCFVTVKFDVGVKCISAAFLKQM